jgi:ATP synthase protein I
MDDSDRPASGMLRELDSGWAMTSEFISAVLVWMGIGWLLDRWLGTDPWLLVAGIVLGFVLGTWLLFLRANEQGKMEDAKRPRL